ncbi:MAG: hypothetical protein ACREE1_00465 [Stellaceae bacterium]
MSRLTMDYIGGLASLAGVAISIIGFIVTVWNVRRSKSAAERAEAAADAARQAMRSYQTLSDFSAAVAMMEEIRRLHRVEQPNLYQFLERYSAARTALIGVRKLSPALSDGMQTQIQSAIMTLSMIEKVVERARAEGSSPDFAELNHRLSVEIDSLHSVLIDMTYAI